MRSCFVLITLLFCSTVWGQDLVVKSFIKDSVVQLRWAPRNYDDLVKGLKSGYQIRMKNDAGPETMFEVKPFLDRDFGVMTDRERCDVRRHSVVHDDVDVVTGCTQLSASAHSGSLKPMRVVSPASTRGRLMSLPSAANASNFSSSLMVGRLSLNPPLR